MRSHFILFPVAIIASAATIDGRPAIAEELSSVADAQVLMFPGATLTPRDFTLSDDQVAILERESRATVFHSKIKVWQASTGGWFFLDQVPGRDDRVTYAVGLDRNGAIKGVEILVCYDGYCGIKLPAWRAQFIGKTYGQGDLSTGIHLISGNTLSSAHVTEGVTRVLATYTLFIKHQDP